MCMDILEICFGTNNGQISSVFDRVIFPPHDSGGGIIISRFYLKILIKYLLCFFTDFLIIDISQIYCENFRNLEQIEHVENLL